MNRSVVVSIYTVISVLIVAISYLLDDILGVWRIGITGVLLLALGYFCMRRKNVFVSDNHFKKVFSFSHALLFACVILMVIAVRLLFSTVFVKVGMDSAPIYKGASLLERFVSTVLMPALCAPVIAFYILPSIFDTQSRVLKVLFGGLAFLPFCTAWFFLPAGFLLGVGIALTDTKNANSMVNCFAAYLVLMLYDTVSVSLNAVHLNLSIRQAGVFLLISLSILLLTGYIAQRILKERKFHIGEFFTVFFLSAVFLLIGIAL